MAKRRQVPEIKRRIPRQARASKTVDAILEAAAQILEVGGLAAFTTNSVAERAGVSIGTLYQYFADKNALLRALAEREMQVGLARVAAAMAGDGDKSLEGRVRATVRAIVNDFGGRQRARKAVVQAILAQGLSVETMGPVAAFIAQQPPTMRTALTREQVFVLSRAVMGTIRAAVLEEQPFFKSRTFEDELVRLVLSYLEAITGSR